MIIELRTDKGLVRSLNEDSIVVEEVLGGKLIVLADGLGGHNAGEIAASMVTEGMARYIKESAYEKGQEENLLKEALDLVNERVYLQSKSVEGQTGMGATVVSAWVFDDRIHIIHAGDSRAYWFDGQRLEQLTVDHSVSNDFKDADQMNEKIRHMVTRAVGTEDTIRGDYQSMPFTDEGTLLLCSDGLSNEVTNEQIEAVLQQYKLPVQIADTLMDQAKAHGGRDNITFALLKRKEVAL